MYACSYSVVADRLETIGLVYLWPEGNWSMAVIDLNEEWLGYVQPVGLVIAPVVLTRHGLNPETQTRAATARRCLPQAD